MSINRRFKSTSIIRVRINRAAIRGVGGDIEPCHATNWTNCAPCGEDVI